MITGPANYGLHVIFLATAMSSSSHRLIVATTSSPSYWLGYQSALAISGAEVLRVACEPKQFALIVGSRRLPADQRLSNLVVVEREGFPHVLQRKATERSHEWSGKGDGWPDTAWPDLWDVNISFNHPPYYSRSKGDGRVVTDKRWAW